MPDRLKFIEDGGAPKKSKVPEPKVEEIRWPILARYDLAGNGPRPGEKHDVRLFDEARMLQTIGEKLSPSVIRIGWIFIRLAIALAFLYFVLRGNTFNCGCGPVIFD
jgi:hypothetical protein